ncbi:MAG: EAL domain-containing protein, partial [Schwartzia sp.]|nr:EAL domain-containing protein [Schwartzia sp. (in: firmicutes)]
MQIVDNSLKNGGLHPVPVSVNMSRCDMYYYQYVEEIERIRQEYEIPVRSLRIEITETSAIAGLGLLTSIIEKLHGLG